MDSILEQFDYAKCINIIIDTIKFINEQRKELIKIDILRNEKLPIYQNVLMDILDILYEFGKLEQYNILSHHKLSFGIIKIINLDMLDVKNNFDLIVSYQTNTDNKCKFCWSKVTDEFLPSEMNKLIENNFIKIFEHLKNLEELKNKIFGSSFRIKHPVLQKIWLLSGLNDINNSYIDKFLFKDNTFNLIKLYNTNIKNLSDVNIIENNKFYNNSNNEKFNKIVNFFKNNSLINNFDRQEKIDFKDSKINKKILNLFDMLDKEKNNKLSLHELNNIPKYYFKFTDIKTLLDNIPIDDFEERKEVANDNINIKTDNVETNFDKEKYEDGEYKLIGEDLLYVDENRNLGDFYPNYYSTKFLFSQKFPKDTNDRKYIKVIFKLNVTDQGWGDTGHVRMAIKLHGKNLKEKKEIVKVDRNDNDFIDNNYITEFTNEEINKFETFELFIVCPMWVGWTANLNKFKCKYVYKDI